ncbi:MAG: Butyrate--acetoacetate CoA-transferase subunit A [Firmicutes bacterium ADurb.Bin182]|nr:MAG: Butyrate--acetoacetate CoA-transferase subunit A [Firmicutes bacterium ADurb.Bin182]
MSKVVTAKEAVSHIKDGDVLLIGGFLQGGIPDVLVGAVLETDAKNLTIVSNDTGTAETNIIKLQQAGKVSKVMATYIGANPETGRMMIEDPTSVQLFPQGTLAEKIRAGGAGIAAFLTPTGVGTIVEEGKQKMELNGREYLLETALRGNVALVHASVADEFGNCFMRGSTKNFNAIMPAACDYVAVEAEKIVPVGELDPELVTVPGIFVDAVVKVGE